MALVSKNFSDIITFSRASAATRVNASGLVESVAANTPRFDYDPITLAARGILIEEQRTNLLTYSQDFTNAAWTQASSITVTPNTHVAPDGTQTATTISDAVAFFSSLARSFSVSNDSASYTVSVYVRKTSGGTSSTFGINISLTGGTTVVNINARLNTDTGAVSGGGGGVQDAGDYWRFRAAIQNNTSGNTSLGFSFYPATSANGSFSDNAAATGSAVIWGAQLEAGSFPTSYIPSTTTFTGRSSTGTFIGANGLIQTAASGVARYQYNPALPTVPPFLLLEAAATNLLTWSEDFTNAVWTTSGGGTGSAPVVTGNLATAPDGSNTADLAVFNAGANSTGADNSTLQGPTFTATAQPYTFSVWLKTSDASTKNVQLSIAGAGALGVTVTGSWQRFSTTWTASAGSWNPRITLGFGLTSATASLHVWGAQLEAGSYATSYIPTTTAAVTRAADTSTSAQTTRSADVASVNTLSPWYNATEGTLYTEFTPYALASDARAVSISDGTSGNRLLTWGTSGSARTIFEVRSGAVEQASIQFAGTYVANAVTKTAAAYRANDFALSVNAGAVLTDTSGTVPSVNRLDFGAEGGGALPINGCIRRFAYYPRRLSNTELQSLTA